jgi:peptidoglycan/xylan/chitin deacetylase (PgdA/CDA1 family)
MKKINMLLALLLIFGCSSMAQNTEKEDSAYWPKGKTYAVSLTYDDGLQSHVDHALPQLKAAGLRGTFFYSGKKSTWSQADVDGMNASGQELAGHSILHPCNKEQSWVSKGNALEDYDDARMEKELDANLANLVARGVDASVATFAYPCGMMYIGEDKHSYVPMVKKRFISARGARNDLAFPGRINMYNINSVHGDKGGKVTQLTWMDKARQQKAWVVYMFHGVGGDHLAISAEDHQALITALAADEKAWVATFSEISAWVKKKQ